MSGPVVLSGPLPRSGVRTDDTDVGDGAAPAATATATTTAATTTIATTTIATTTASPTADGTRGRRQHALLRIRGPLDIRWRVGLAAGGLLLIGIAWTIASSRAGAGASLLPSPTAVVTAVTHLWSSRMLTVDLWASSQRILIGYSLSVFLGSVFGIAIGTFASVESFFEAQIGFLRYIPASALTPVFLLWFGIGESPKIWLIVVGTVFFNILMIADSARAVPRELLHASYTLGAGRRTTLRRVILRHSLPGIIDAARVNLAAAWLMLVVAELLAADKGLAFQIVRAQRFRSVSTMFALFIVFGVIGLASDLLLRLLRNVTCPWART